MALTSSLTPKLEKQLKTYQKKAVNLVTEFEIQKEFILTNTSESSVAGNSLSGDLQGFRSLDWNYKGIALRICFLYNPTDSHIYFVWFGTRENFYGETKRYLKSIKHRL
ncbi:type II toxin-antitoxin system RelE/ParE family toxin [Aneurinibacillus aneurinilyticus]|uniref:type II toxin-antitoxin system RelE/ParE family toxin n=1 Tax=Aneurinibacillus aneurinilyticus TaxID=1391 RepID=UPI002E1B680B|nr:type II toxin-antitoxin system RelE/ParE family toxin [Aneurinibacillus aneurinilyticus]